MKLFAMLVGAAAASSFAAGLWLALRTLRLVRGDDYAMFHGLYLFSGSGNGLGIFIPALLLLALGWVLARFARNLWTES